MLLIHIGNKFTLLKTKVHLQAFYHSEHFVVQWTMLAPFVQVEAYIGLLQYLGVNCHCKILS